MKNSNLYRLAYDWFMGKGWLYLTFIIIFYLIFFKYLHGTSSAIQYLIFGSIPIILLGIILILKFSKYCFYFLFSIQFIIVICCDFVDIPFGLITYISSFALTLLFILYFMLYDKTLQWEKCKTIMLWSILIWSGYCILEIANPNTVIAAWNVTMAQYVFYPLMCTILIPLTIHKIKDINLILIIWSIFIIISAAIAFRQQHFGWNAKENNFLFVLGGATTHIIWSGIRYFSCFTDAANFGVHMAMAATTFGISIFYTKNKFLKLYFFFVMSLAIYGFAISGTRTALAVPLGGLLLMTILSKNIKTGITSIFILILFFSFFAFTHIGDGNSYIHKMRSAFNPSKDPSYIVRVEHRKKMKVLMIRKPIGYGLGLSKPGLFHPKERMPYPPDSFLISIWVETGYIGLVIYLIVHGVLFAWASYLLLFKVQNKHIRGLLAAWLCMCAGFFIAAYGNDVMQYPNSIVIYTGFALCFTAPIIDKNEQTNNIEINLKK